MADPNKLYLWEILVPATRDTGHLIKAHFHKDWDRRVRKITKGLTILQPVRGQWVSTDGKLFLDKMIPVRIACTEPIIHQIADFSASYYKQKSIMYYRISSVIYFTKIREEVLTTEPKSGIIESLEEPTDELCE